MKFSNTVRRREVAFMIRLLTIFGVVEQRQSFLWPDPRTSPARGPGLFLAGRPIPRNKSILIRSREDAGSHHGFLGIHPDERSCAGFLCE